MQLYVSSTSGESPALQRGNPTHALEQISVGKPLACDFAANYRPELPIVLAATSTRLARENLGRKLFQSRFIEASEEYTVASIILDM